MGTVETRRRAELELRLADALCGRSSGQQTSPEDRAALLACAERHGLSGLLAAWHPDFRHAGLAPAALFVRSRRTTLAVVRELERREIPVVLMKGLSAALLWEQPSARFQSDVDVLVPPKRLREAVAALMESGVAKSVKWSGAHSHNASLIAASNQMLIEVHHEVSSYQALGVTTDELLSRRTSRNLEGQELPTLEPHDAAVYLALHAATHALKRLSWLWDLRCLARREALDWTLVAERARDFGVHVPVALSWTAARALFDAPIPPEALAALGANSLHARFATGAWRAQSLVEGPIQPWFERVFRATLVPARHLPAIVAKRAMANLEEYELIDRPGDAGG